MSKSPPKTRGFCWLTTCFVGMDGHRHQSIGISFFRFRLDAKRCNWTRQEHLNFPHCGAWGVPTSFFRGTSWSSSWLFPGSFASAWNRSLGTGGPSGLRSHSYRSAMASRFPRLITFVFELISFARRNDARQQGTNLLRNVKVKDPIGWP